MQKLILSVLFLTLSLNWLKVSALELTEIKPDDSVVLSLGRNIEEDRTYLKDIANIFNDRFVVTEESYVDTTEIDRFYAALSTPLSLEEIDKGQLHFTVDQIGDKEYQKFLTEFKILGSMAGYSAEFEPISYFQIYRDISLVGGYVRYIKKYADPNEAFQQYVYNVETLTKERLFPPTKKIISEKIQRLFDAINADNTFKVFILKDSKIDSMYAKEDNK